MMWNMLVIYSDLFISLWTDGDFCHQGRNSEIAPFKIVGTYWHDHSLENCWGALSDGTVGFTIFGGKYFSQETAVLNELKKMNECSSAFTEHVPDRVC
jgi:hypothetical protein